MFNKKVEAQHRTQWFSMLKRWQPSIGPCDFYAKKSACDQPYSNNHNPSTITVISHVDEYGQPLKNCMQCWRAMHIYRHGIYDFSSRFSSKLEKIATPYWIRKKFTTPFWIRKQILTPLFLALLRLPFFYSRVSTKLHFITSIQKN